MFRYPWTNTHELNLNWIIQQVRDGLVDHGCVFVRPEDFPDSENPIQEAMDAAERDNKMVLLSGAYSINTTLVPPENTIIIGIENATISTVQDEGLGFAPVTILKCTSGLYVRGVTFDGNRPEGPSQSTYPSLHPGELVNVNPLVMCWEDVEGVTFEDCTWFNFDSNRSTANTSALYAALGCYMASNITVRGCYFRDIRLECTVFDRCEDVRIIDSNFDCGNEAGVYTDIGLLRTNNVVVEGCVIHHGDDLTTSTINAMGDNITIKDCEITALKSSHGIDYGNEVVAGLVNSGLYILNNKLCCHIDPAGGSQTVHDDIIISGNVIETPAGSTLSGNLMLYATTPVHYTIRDNIFIGNTQDAIRCLTEGSGATIMIDGNDFRFRAIRLHGAADGLIVRNCTFHGRAVTNTDSYTDETILTMIGCTMLDDIGYQASNGQVKVVLIGCDLANTVATNMHPDTTLSYVRV